MGATAVRECSVTTDRGNMRRVGTLALQATRGNSSPGLRVYYDLPLPFPSSKAH
jgi:hypothetical protein